MAKVEMETGMSPLIFKKNLQSLVDLGLTETQAIAYLQMHFQFRQDVMLRQRIQLGLRAIELRLMELSGNSDESPILDRIKEDLARGTFKAVSL